MYTENVFLLTEFEHQVTMTNDRYQLDLRIQIGYQKLLNAK